MEVVGLSHEPVVACHLCGRPLDHGLCPHCDARRGGWTGRAAATLRLGERRWLPIVTVLAVALAIVLGGRALIHPRSQGEPSPSARPVQTESPTSSPTLQALAASAGSTFEVLGDERDEFGHRSRRGYAFVVHADSGTSDLLTDYDLVVEQFVRGDRTVELGRGDQSFTATIVAVSPDPHVALLRISGTYPVLPLATAAPQTGETVRLGEDGSMPAPRAAVVAYHGSGATSHLTFSVAVDSSDDGGPVLNGAGQVVGIAEPGSPFGVEGVGFAVPIRPGCLAVAAC